MKNKNAFTLVELLVVIAIIGILASLLIPAVHRAQQKQQKQHLTNTPKESNNPFQAGDIVYIEGMDVTGRVNVVHINVPFGAATTVDLLVKNTNGTISTIERINISLLKKVSTTTWK